MMKKMFATMTAAALGLALVAATPASANLLVNPGFETAPFVDDGSGVGKWLPFGGSGIGLPTQSAIDSAMPLSGNNNAHLILDDIANNFAGLFQEIAVSAGDVVTASIWHKSLSGATDGSEFRIEWVDSGGGEISRDQITPVPTTAYTQISLTDVVAPAGAVAAKMVYAIQSFGGGASQDIVLDDASYVPEPASMALLGLGALAMLRRR